MEFNPQCRPVLGEDLRAQLSALAAGRFLATVPLGRIHALPLYPGHLHGRGHHVVSFEEALPEVLLGQRWSTAANFKAVHNFLLGGFGG